jgi:hypothetical protein
MNLNQAQRLRTSRMALYAATAEDLFVGAVVTSRGSRTPPVINGVLIGGVLNEGNWTIFGQLRADDDIDLVQSLRTAFDLPQDDYFYGLILERQVADEDFAVGDLLVIVRGTGTGKEWLLDFCVLPETDISTAHALAGVVPEGFYSIYKSMELLDKTGTALGQAAHAIADFMLARPQMRLTIAGHSLGAALVSYLAFDVATLLGPQAVRRLDSYMIACPNPGDRLYATGFKAAVPSYTVVNWSADLVPKVPPFPFGPLLDGAVQATSTQNVAEIEPTDAAADGWAPKNTPACNHQAVSYARLLDPANPYAIQQTQAAGCG